MIPLNLSKLSQILFIIRKQTSSERLFAIYSLANFKQISDRILSDEHIYVITNLSMHHQSDYIIEFLKY